MTVQLQINHLIHHNIIAFTLTTSDGALSSEITVSEGETQEICFITTSIITRSSLELGLEVVSSYYYYTDATINGMTMFKLISV